MARHKIHESSQWHLAQFGGAPERYFFLAIKFQSQQLQGFSGHVFLLVQRSTAEAILFDPRVEGFCFLRSAGRVDRTSKRTPSARCK